MGKPLQNIVIIIGMASVVFSLYGVVKGGDFMDAIGGITIGVCLIGAVFFEKK